MTVTSSVLNLVTGSENANAAVNASTPTTTSGTPILSAGAVASHVAVALTACAGPALPWPSTAAPTMTVIVTSSPIPHGVTSSV